MTYAGNYIGADGQSWPEVASRAVQNVHAQHRSPYYGYIRNGNNTPIYVIPEGDNADDLLEVARVWFSQHVQMPDHDYIAVFSAADLRAPIAGMEHFKRTTVGCVPQIDSYPQVGADGQSWPEIAARQVQSVHAEHPNTPYFGYIRSGNSTPIHLLPDLEFARRWYSLHVQVPDHDYIAVFGRDPNQLDRQGPTTAADLQTPIAGMEHFKRTTVGCIPQVGVPPIGCDPQVGNWPFFLGLPLGGLAGYFLRRWQEQHPGLALPGVPAGQLPAPKIPPEAMALAPNAPNVGGPWLDLVEQDYGGFSDGYGYGYGGQDYGYGNPSVGSGPWLDLVGQAYDGQDYGYSDPSVGCPDYGYPSVGGEWYDIVGATADERARTRAALLQSAIQEVVADAARFPPEATAFVWLLEPPVETTFEGAASATPTPLSNVLPFGSAAEATAYARKRQANQPIAGDIRPIIALGMFDRTKAQWPTPSIWTVSNDPANEPALAWQAAQATSARASGTYTGAEALFGAALNDVRDRAKQIAAAYPNNVIGVIHTVKDNKWHPLAFTDTDKAFDWFDKATKDQNSYTYAAYFDRGSANAYEEKIGGFRTPKSTQGIVGGWRAA